MKREYFKALIKTPLGRMIAIADEHALHFLEFVDDGEEKKTLEQFCKKRKATVEAKSTPPLSSIENELERYFKGNLHAFKTPIAFFGSPFLQKVWKELQNIAHGETRSYAEIARAIGKKSAYRAVARANSLNPLAIIVPCHRVINSNGKLSGYAGGVHRKKWLLDHEKHERVA